MFLKKENRAIDTSYPSYAQYCTYHCNLRVSIPR